MPKITLYGFDGSTYVRTVKMLLAEKGVSDYTQVPVNVLKGEPHAPEHLRRHPFGKVPAVDVDGFTLIETAAICRYLDELLPGPSLLPADEHPKAKADEAICVIDSYGYGALAGGVAAYHLFPDLFGGKTEKMREDGLQKGRIVLEYLMGLGHGDFIVGPLSLADLFLAPIMAYVAMTPDKDALFDLPGVRDWWGKVEALPSFRSTAPKFD